MTWLAFRVEVWTMDEREDSVERLRTEVLRAVEYRFGAATVKRSEPDPVIVPGYLDRLEANRKE